MSSRRIKIPELSALLEGATNEDLASLGSACIPFSGRPIYLEDLGIQSKKGRNDLVAIRVESGKTKFTRSISAEIRPEKIFSKPSDPSGE